MTSEQLAKAKAAYSVRAMVWHIARLSTMWAIFAGALWSLGLSVPAAVRVAAGCIALLSAGTMVSIVCMAVMAATLSSMLGEGE